MAGKLVWVAGGKPQFLPSFMDLVSGQLEYPQNTTAEFLYSSESKREEGGSLDVFIA